MNAITLQAKNIQELRAELNSEKAQNLNPTLAIVFCSIEFPLEQVRALFTEKNIVLFGCTTNGEILNDTYFDHGLTGVLLNLSTDAFKVINTAREGASTYELARKAGKQLKGTFHDQSILLLAQGIGVNADTIIKGLKEELGESVPIFGGLAGDNLTMKTTFVFSNDSLYPDGLVSLIFDQSRVQINGLATCGWEPIGVYHEVTKAVDNVLYEIDKEPALKVFLKYFGHFGDINVGIDADNLSEISAQYPIQILREDGSSVLRSPVLGNKEDNSLVLAGGVETGDRFRFSISPGFEVIDQTVQEFGAFQETVPEVDALILFSSAGRLGAFGPLMEDEIKGIYDHWKKPMVGFFSYGEIGATKDANCDFHNETCTLVTLKEID